MNLWELKQNAHTFLDKCANVAQDSWDFEVKQNFFSISLNTQLVSGLELEQFSIWHSANFSINGDNEMIDASNRDHFQHQRREQVENL